jgi:hypothetical protein
MPFPNAGDVNTATKTGVKEFVFAKMATQQSTNIAANDHIKFDTIVTSRGGSVALDTTTAYVTTAGAASVGRFTLKGGLTYKLTAAVSFYLGSAATSTAVLRFYDATNAANLPGVACSVWPASDATGEFSAGEAVAVFTAPSDVLVELRIISATTGTRYGNTGSEEVWALVETI